jgi:hypothetical protein
MYSWMYQAHELCRQMFVPEFAKQFRMHLPPLGRNLTTEEDAILKEATSTLRGMATRVSIEHLRDQGG